MIDCVHFSTGPAVGADGLATATAHSPHVSGKVLAAHIAYVGSPPAGTTDFTLSDEGDPASESIITLVDTATNVKIAPRRMTEKNDGTDILYVAGEEVYEPYVVYGRLEATIAQANAGDSVTVTVWMET